MRVTKEQIQEWTESPVTTELSKLFEDVLIDLEARGFDEFYHPGQPELTQESLARRAGVTSAYKDVLEALEGDWSMFDEEEDESERH